MTPTVFPGLKYETTENENNIIFYRILRPTNNEDEYFAIIEGDNSYKQYRLSTSYLMNNCVKIAPDAFINIMDCDINEDGDEDIFVCVNKSNDMGSDNNKPSLILRQNVFGYTKSILPENINSNDIFVGECFTTYNADNLMEQLQFTDIVSQYSIAFYLGDSQDLINRFIEPKVKKNLAKTLKDIRDSFKKFKDNTYKGFSDSIESLMEDNNFIVGLYGIFNIMYIDFNIDLKTNHNDEDDIELTLKQINRLQNYMGKFIANPIVVKYDRDININEIVSKQHIMVVDPTSTVYLIAYDLLGYYNEGNEDILQAML